MSERTTVAAPDAPAAIGPYSHAVRGGDALYCSGQIPLDPASGEMVERLAGRRDGAVPATTWRRSARPPAPSWAGRCG